MESRDLKNLELNDEDLENVSGGNTSNGVPGILDDQHSFQDSDGQVFSHFVCANCQREFRVLQEHLSKHSFSGQYYCKDCKAALGLGWQSFLP